jgi:glyoxylase-like metal-dependent hydrolase (beta-lactamase superfamily II)
MAGNVFKFRTGKAEITVINIADAQLIPAETYVAPGEEELLASPEFRQPVPIAMQTFHIALPDLSAVVDPGRYDPGADPESVARGYVPPPDLLASLRTAGIDPEAVGHVVITHSHWDHLNGVTVERARQLVPLFPNARHYIGLGDWEAAQPLLGDPASLESRTLGVLHRRGLLDTVDGRLDLSSPDGVSIVPTPGETPGHQVVRLSSEGEVTYFLGDLIHLLLEVEHMGWTPNWATDREQKLRSREAIFEAAAGQGNRALLCAAHIAGAGRLRLHRPGYAWELAIPFA